MPLAFKKITENYKIDMFPISTLGQPVKNGIIVKRVNYAFLQNDLLFAYFPIY